jgi:hypothetical protein
MVEGLAFDRKAKQKQERDSLSCRALAFQILITPA